MRKTHKNLIFECLSKSPYGIDSFDIIDSDESNTVIYFGDTQFKFEILVSPDNYDSYYVSSVQYAPVYPIVGTDNPIDIADLINQLQYWIVTNIKPYLEDEKAIDLWDAYKNSKQHLDVEDLNVDDTSNFSNDDRYQIQFAVQDLKLMIPAKFNLTNEQLLIVNKKLDYLVAASSRVTKTDWKGLLVSMVFSIIVALSLDRERGHQLWELVMQVFRNIRLLSN